MANLQHIKGSRTKVLNTFPTKTFGNDGDIVISRISGKGVFLCSKAGGMWYAANKMQELDKLEKTSIRELTTNKLTVNRMINTENSPDRFVVSDAGNLKYMTGEQVVGDLPLPVNNIDYKSAYCSLGQYSDKDTCESNGGTWYYSENDSHDSISSTAENQLLTVGESIGGIDAESTLLYDGSTLEIKRNTDYDENWQTSSQTNLLKLSYDLDDYATISVNERGATTISTIDAAGAIAHLSLVPDGDLILDPASQKTIINAIDRLYFDGGTDTYIVESSSDNLRFVVGGVALIDLTEGVSSALNVNSSHITVDAAKKLFLDGSAAGHTYIQESSDDILDIYVGGDKMLSLDESVDTGVTSLLGTFKIAEQANASADTAGYGQIWVDNTTPNILMFTDDTGIDIQLVSNTAVWGGAFARTTASDGKWIGIPTGHQTTVISFGTTSAAPDTSYTITTTADDMCGVIFQSLHRMKITKCRIYYGQGGATNTAHHLCLMKYDIDSNGDLTNGEEVGGVDTDLGNDDYTTLAFTDLTITGDNIVSNAQVLIAMVYQIAASNGAFAAKCIIEYQELS